MAKAEIRLGLVGIGKIARDQHLPAIAANSRFTLVATADPNGAIAGTNAYASLESLIAAEPDLDAIVLCTPPSIRVGLAQQALAAGLDVMLEKPPASCVSQIEALAQSARASDRVLFTAWHSRETAAVDAATTWLRARRIDSVEVIWREDVRVWHPGQDWLLAAGGFGVFDSAINALSVVNAILPDRLVVERAQLGIPQNRQAPMTASLVMRHGRSVPVRCDLSILHGGPPIWDIVVETDAGSLRLSHGGHKLHIDGSVQAVDKSNEYSRLYSRFVSLIDDRRSDVDWNPLTQVGDAFLVGEVNPLPAFEF